MLGCQCVEVDPDGFLDVQVWRGEHLLERHGIEVEQRDVIAVTPELHRLNGLSSDLDAPGFFLC